MHLDGNQLRLSATDLANYLACCHLTALDRLAALGQIAKPMWQDPALEVLRQRGLEHEAAYVGHLQSAGLSVCDLRDDGQPASPLRTAEAMATGVDVIVQPTFADGRWHGRADVLLRSDGESDLGSWQYEVIDTKLSQNTRAGTILQLCLYTDLVGRIQGRIPIQMHVVKPGCDFQPETFRFPDFQAYYRLVARQLEEAVDRPGVPTYPYPVPQCDVCRWWRHCDDRRRGDDHLCLVAGAGLIQIRELEGQGVRSLEQFADAATPLPAEPSRGAMGTCVGLQHQARVQLTGRRTGAPYHELLAPEAHRGLLRLPEPSAGDLFFDIESDMFVDGGGLEYLFGAAWAKGDGTQAYRSWWALDRLAERRAFEELIDFFMERWRLHPGMHIYHFSPYELGAVKRLIGRHATRVDEVDRLLRGKRFVDLLAVTRQGLRASVERYSLKDLERFCGFTRGVDLRVASAARQRVECALELGTVTVIDPEDKSLVEGYNRDDCVATAALRDWLEELRAELEQEGHALLRPTLESGEPSEGMAVRQSHAQDLFDRLVDDLPEERADWATEHEARWLLAHLLDYFRREEKCVWWEYFRLCELEEEDLLDERKSIARLTFVQETDAGTDRRPVHRYNFPPQEAVLSGGEELHESGVGNKIADTKLGRLAAIDEVAGTIDIKKSIKSAPRHPSSVFAWALISAGPVGRSLEDLCQSVTEHGVDGNGPYRAARDLLLRKPPRSIAPPEPALRRDGEGAVDAAIRIARDLDHGVLAIQGPPGTGKTTTAACMIAELVRAGRRVGVTAVSHKVIRHLLEKAIEEGEARGVTVDAVHKTGSSDDHHASSAVEDVAKNDDALAALNLGQVVGGTAWLWASDKAVESLDYLFVDEAGQMSLALVLAASRAARNLVLIGDPQQLEQPQQGTHPEGADVAALNHLLGGLKTIPSNLGLFLDSTRRLAPGICEFTSEVFYEDRLRPSPGLVYQKIVGNTPFSGSGLRYVPIHHEGNTIASPEEVEAVVHIVDSLTQSGVEWVDCDGVHHPMRREDVLVVAPFNAHVGALRARLPGVQIGTVDKFQGQEAPVVIYTMASSSAEDVPRGMSFLYSPNRFNVATSRAKCLSIVVATERLLEPDCRTPDQMRWANALCRYRELATVVRI